MSERSQPTAPRVLATEATTAGNEHWQTVDPAGVAASDRRGAFLGVQLGAAFGLLAVAAAAITLVWLEAFVYRIGNVTTMTALGLALSVVEFAILAAQWLLWRRYLRCLPDDHDAALKAPIPGRGASWTLHLLSYLVTLAAVVCLVWAMSGIGFDQLGFWLLAVAALAVMLGHSFGGVQFLRHGGPAGTLRTHLRRFVERNNARADAEFDELEARAEASERVER